jgi:hypothetical protein
MKITLADLAAAPQPRNPDRRLFIGGSDARIIMSPDEAGLIRLWKEKRGEVEPEDLSGNLIVQLGIVTEALNRSWYERNTLLHFCALVSSLIIDEDGVYDPRLVNDRLLLGMKGTQRARAVDVAAAFARGFAPEGDARRSACDGRHRLSAQRR